MLFYAGGIYPIWIDRYLEQRATAVNRSVET